MNCKRMIGVLLAIVLAVLGFNLLGQGLQDVLDPYHKKRA